VNLNKQAEVRSVVKFTHVETEEARGLGVPAAGTNVCSLKCTLLAFSVGLIGYFFLIGTIRDEGGLMRYGEIDLWYENIGPSGADLAWGICESILYLIV
jgi:hypothetical protein